VNPKFTGPDHPGQMDRATRIRTTARWLLLVGGLTCAIGMVGPFRGIEHAFVPWDKAAHFIAFYGVTLLAFSAFPDRRRLDLAVLATFAGTAVEVLQLLDGRDAELGDVLADAAGAFAVLAPIYLERLRQPRIERRRSQGAPVPVVETEPA
jgi:VanZ family protein